MKTARVRTRRLTPYPLVLGFCVRELDGDVANTWSDGGRVVVSFSESFDEQCWREAVPHEAAHVKQAVEEYVEEKLGGEPEAYLVEEICRRANEFLDEYLRKRRKR